MFGGYIYLLEVIEPRSSAFGYLYVGQHLVNKNNPTYFSGGVRIKQILNKYGEKAFKRTIIVNNIFNSELLNELEIHYIQLYNTFYKTSKRGLNLTKGGGGIRGFKYTEETKEKMSLSKKLQKRSEEHKLNFLQAILKANCKKVLQFDKQNNFIKEWDSIIEASKELKIHNGNIGECCINKRRTAGNYKWKYN